MDNHQIHEFGVPDLYEYAPYSGERRQDILTENENIIDHPLNIDAMNSQSNEEQPRRNIVENQAAQTNVIVNRRTFRELQTQFRQLGELEEEEEWDEDMSESQKVAIRNAKIRDFLFDFTLFILCLYMPLEKKEDALMCKTPIFKWLLIQSIFYLVDALKNLSIIWIVYRLRRPTKAKRILDTLYICIFMNL